jgi:ABC-type dipeptide/oligopeptide/nickel transport system permease component
VRGDLGRSLETKDPVLPAIVTGFKNSLLLATTALLLSSAIGLAIGIVSATRPRSVVDRLGMLVALFGNSMPAFWLGLMLILVFSVQLHWFPVGGMYSLRGDGGPFELLHHLVLPSVTLGMLSLAIVARMTRASLREVLNQDYLRTARAKGLRERSVITRHALTNALLPIVTVIALQLGLNLGGAVLTETVFTWPGLGRQIYRSITTRDVVMLQAGVLVIATSFVLINTLVDLIYAYLDPRIRYE